MPFFLHGAKGNFQKEAALAPSPHSLTFLNQTWQTSGQYITKERTMLDFLCDELDGYVRPFATRQKSQPAYEGSVAVAFNCYTSVKPVVVGCGGAPLIATRLRPLLPLSGKSNCHFSVLLRVRIVFCLL